MSKLGELLLRRFVKPALRAPSKRTPRSHDDYVMWQYNSSGTIIDKITNMDLVGKRVLDIGCGTGGRSAYLASCGAAEVVGIDINGEEIELAQSIIPKQFPELSERITFYKSEENEIADFGLFDIVILIDAIEHVVSPPSMMKLAYDYLKEGGTFYFTCIGYYNHHGSHMGMVPFVNVFFSDETILNVHRWKLSHPNYLPTRFDSDPPVERWLGLYDLRDRPGEHMNKLTIKEVKKLLKYSIYKENSIEICGYNNQGFLLSILNLLRRVPVLQEMFHSLVIGRCIK